MIETLVGVSVSPSNTEDLLEEPSLAYVAVAGARESGEPDDAVDLAEPSEDEWRSRGSWFARPGPAGWR